MAMTEQVPALDVMSENSCAKNVNSIDFEWNIGEADSLWAQGETGSDDDMRSIENWIGDDHRDG